MDKDFNVCGGCPKLGFCLPWIKSNTPTCRMLQEDDDTDYIRPLQAIDLFSDPDFISSKEK